MDSDIDFSSFETPQAEPPKPTKPLAFKPTDDDGLPDFSGFAKTKPKPKPEPTEYDYNKGADEILKEDTDIPQLYLHAQSVGDKHGQEMARRAYHKQRNQGFLSDVGDVVSTLASPSTWAAAASGVGDYAVGLTAGLARTGYGLAQGAYGQAGKSSADMLRQIAGEESRKAERALAAGDRASHAKSSAKAKELNAAADEKEKSAQEWLNAYRGSKMEATLAAQGIENQIRHLGSSALNAVTHVPYKTKSRQQTDAELVQKAIDAKKAMDLQEGNVSDAGFVGYLAGAGDDQPASQTFEEWKAAGAKPDPYWTRVMQAGADPMMHVYAKLPHVPGAQKAGAAGAWAAGKLLRSPQYILDKARRAAKVSKIAKHGATAAGASVVVAEALVHGGFKAGASLAATLLAYTLASRAARIMSAAGVFLESHGSAVWTGKATPGAIRKAMGARYGTSVPFATYLGDFTGQTIVATGAGMAGGLGLNLLLAGGDPKEFAHLEATAGAFASGMTFLKLASFGARGEHNQAIRKYLVVEGKRLVDFNSKYGEKTKELFDGLTEDSQNLFLEAVGTASNLPFTMPDGTVVPVQIHLIDSQTMKRMVDSIQNGFFDGAGNLFINVDQVSTESNGKRELVHDAVAHVLGHELGHPLLFNTLRYVYPEQFAALVDVAKEELFNEDGTPTKETKEFMDGYNTRLLAGFGEAMLDAANSERLISAYNYEKAMRLAQNLLNASFADGQPTEKGIEWSQALGVDIADVQRYRQALERWSSDSMHDSAQAELYVDGKPTQKAVEFADAYNAGLENAYNGFLLSESNPIKVADEWFCESAGQQIASEGFGSAALQSSKMQKIADRIRSLIAQGSGLPEFRYDAKFGRSENPRVARAVRAALESLSSLQTKRVGAPSPTGPETSMPAPGAPTAPTSGSPGYVPPVYVPPKDLTPKEYARKVLLRQGLSEKKADEWLSQFPDDHPSIDDMLNYRRTTGAPVIKQQATKGGATSRKGARNLLKEAGLTEQQTTDAIRAAQAQRGGVVLDPVELARLALEAHRSKPTAPPSSEGSSLTAAPVSPTETSKGPAGTVVSESPASAETGASMRPEGAGTSPATGPASAPAEKPEPTLGAKGIPAEVHRVTMELGASIVLKEAGLTEQQATDAIKAAQAQRGGIFRDYVDLAQAALAIHGGTAPEQPLSEGTATAPKPAPEPTTPSEPATPAAPEAVRPMTAVEVLGVVLQAQETAAAELAKNKRVKIDSKASQDKIKNAGIEALLTVAEDNLEQNGIRRRTNPVTGTESIGGLFNPENVVDVELVGMAGITEPMQRTMLELQANIGRPVLVRDYGHAPEARGDVTAASRRVAQEESTAAERARGAADIQYGDKLFVPLSFSFNLGGPNSEPSVTVTGVSPDKLFSNFKNIKEALKRQRLDVHYSGVDSPLFIADVQGAVVNYTNGWVADGSRPIAGTKLTPGYEPYVMDNASDTPNAKLFYKAENGELVPFSRFLVFNLIMGQEGAISGEKKLTDVQAAYQNLARENAVAVSDKGEVNPLREYLNQQMGGHSYTTSSGKVRTMTWSRYTIENPLSETLRVDLIGGAVEPATGQSRSSNIRPSASDESISQAFAKGYPPAEYSAAGFMPTEKKNPSARFMPYAGEKAAGFEEAEKKGLTFKGFADSKPRFEISDKEMTLHGPAFLALSNGKSLHGRELVPIQDFNGVRFAERLENLIDHPTLFENYPNAKNILVRFDPTLDAENAQFEKKLNLISLNPKNNNLKSSLIHEIQHWIQSFESHPRGASVDFTDKQSLALSADLTNLGLEYSQMARNKVVQKYFNLRDSGKIKEMIQLSEDNPEVFSRLNELILNKDIYSASDLATEGERLLKKADAESPYGRYKRSAGEYEARDAAFRKDLSDEERRATAPYTSENLRPEDAIVRFMPKDSELPSNKRKRPSSEEARSMMRQELDSPGSLNKDRLQEALDDPIRGIPTRMVPIPTKDTLPKNEEIRRAMGERLSEKGYIGEINRIEDGAEITSRQDVPSYTEHKLGVVTVMDAKNGTTVYVSHVVMDNPNMMPSRAEQSSALRIGAGDRKTSTIKIKATKSKNQSLPKDLDTWTQVGFNPDRHSYYYLRSDGSTPVVGGSKAVQVGNTVFVKDPVFADKYDSAFRYMPSETIVEPGFYSKAGKVLLDKMPARTSAGQIKGILDPQKGSGVKPDELKWSGLIPYVESVEAAKGFVTKDDVRTFLKDGYGARFEENVVGTNADGNSFYSIDERWGGEGPVEFSTISNAVRAAEQMFELSHQEAVQFVDETNQSESLQTDNGVRYSKYSLPGGTNYKEIVLTMPGIEYTSSHFGSVPNYVAHMRTAEHGNGLLIEEIQSDLHQAARKKDEHGRIRGYKVDQVGYYNRVREIEEKGKSATLEERKEWADLMNAGAMRQDGVEDAPFRKDWQLQLFKRALKQAVDDGKEWIGWTGGVEQAARYPDHAKEKGMTGSYDVMLPIEIGKYVKQWGAKIKPSSIEAGIDNSVVRTVWDEPDYRYTNNGWVGVTSGNELPIGSPESMALSAYIGRYNESQITGAAKQILRSGDIVGHPKKEVQIWRIDITPEMVSSVSEGQPLFMPTEKEPTPKERAQARKMDREYMAAVQAGDTERVQEMVNDAASKLPGQTFGPLRHGTTHEFTVFDRTLGNIEGNFGRGNYLTSSYEDVSSNYAGKGPDLTIRIEREIETILDNDFRLKNLQEVRVAAKKYGIDLDSVELKPLGKLPKESISAITYWVANEIAEQKLLGKKPRVVNAFVTLQNPAILGGKNATRLEYSFNESTGQETGSVIDLIEAVKTVANKFSDTSADQAIESLTQQDLDGIPLNDAIELLRKSEGLAYATNENGELASGEALRQIIQEMGYDGIVDYTVNDKFGSGRKYGKSMAGMGPDTFHVIAFDSNQIKSSDPVTYDNDGNVIPLSERFNPAKEDIRFMPSEEPTPKERAQARKMDREYMAAVQAGNVEKMDALLKQAASLAGYAIGPVFHGTPTGGFTVFDPSHVNKSSGHSRNAFAFTTNENAAESYANSRSNESVALDEAILLINKAFRKFDGDKPTLDYFESVGFDTSEGFLPEFTWQGVDDHSGFASDLKWYADGLKSINPELSSSLLAGVDKLNSDALNPEVKRVFLKIPSNAPVYQATPKTLGTVMAYFNAMEEPSRSAIVEMPNGEKVFYVADSNQIKSAEHYQRDDSGNLIPLSERFNPAKEDTRFMPSEGEPVPSQDKLDKMKERLPKYSTEIETQETEEGVSASIYIRPDGAPKDSAASIGRVTYKYEEPDVLHVDATSLGHPRDAYAKQGYGEALYREIAKFAQGYGASSILGAPISQSAVRSRMRLFDTETGRPDPQGGYTWAESKTPSNVRFMATEGQHEDGLPDFSAVHILHKRDSFIKPLVNGKKSEVGSILKDAAKGKWGRVIQADDITPAEEAAIVMNGAAEVKTELSKSNNAADWYTEAIKRAIEIASILYPELRDDAAAKKKGFQNAKQAEMVMAVALAITSQNLTVPLNTRYAIQQYEAFRATKRFNPKIADKYGTKSKAIIGNLKLANLILEFFTNKTGSVGIALDEMNKFFSADFEVGQLEKYAAEAMQAVDSDASVNVAGRVDDKVKGSAIFGPKIGQGFYQNLIGNFTPVTVDLWCRRMWGRWTGAVLPDGISPTQIAKFVDTMREQGVELPSALRGIKVITATNKAGTEYRTITKSAHNKINNSKGATLEIFRSAKVEMAKWSRIYEKIRIGMTPQEVKSVRSGKLSLEDLAKQVTKHYEQRKAEWIKYTASVNKGKSGEDRQKFTAKEKAAWLKAYDKSKGRTQVLKNEDISENKPEWVKNAKVVVDQSEPIDVPTDLERRVITRVINSIRQTLEAEGIKTTNADIQAILWYPEKDIWAVLAGEKESGLKNSYDEEFLKVAESRGFGERARAVFGKPKTGTP